MLRKALGYVGPFVGLALFVGALALLTRELRGQRFRDALAHLSAISGSRILAAIALTAVSYLVLTAYDAVSLRYVRKALPYRRIAFASFVNYAFSQSLGFPLLTGGAVRYRLYSGWGLSAIQITGVVAFASLSFWLGVLLVGGAVLALRPDFAALLPLPAPVVRPAGIAALLVVAAYVLWTATGRRLLRVRGVRMRRPAVRLALQQLLVGAADWFAVAAVLYVLLPSGLGISYPAFLAIFLIAFVAGLVSTVPGGLGVFETVIVMLMPEGANDAAILGALVAYRGIYFLLPLLLAAAALGVHEAARRAERIREWAGLAGRWIPALTPSVFAMTTFAGGVILLFSGATPSSAGRLRWVNDVLPLPVIEASHLLASLAGIGLVALAAGLQRRLDAAYHLTVALLLAGIVFSLAKGLDYEEATALSIMLATLVPARRHFFRKASLWGELFSPGWIASMLFVLAGTAWLGYFSYRNAAYGRDVWWRFALQADAPRSLRALVAASAVVLLIALRRLLRPVAERSVAPSPTVLAAAEAIARDDPDTMGFLALTGDKRLLFSESGRSFVMYAVEGRSWVALSDPVGDPAESADLLWTFRALVDRGGGWPVAYLVKHDRLAQYVDLGLTLVKIGEEARVPLATFSLEGRERKKMRNLVNGITRRGGTFEVVPQEALAALMPELRAVSDRWLSAKRTREKGFSLGVFDEAYIARFPVAVLRLEGAVVAFANVWPGGAHHELSVDLMRYDPARAPDGSMEYLLIHLMLWGRSEGYQWFALGMAPLSGLENRSFAPLWNRVGALVFRLGEHFYNFQGLRRYKEQFDPMWVPRYVAAPGGLLLPRVLANIATLISGGVKGVVAR